MGSVRTALVAGLALVLVAGVVVLSGSPPRVLATNATGAGTELAVTGTNARACQRGERLPGGTDAIRLSLGAFTGPALKVQVLSAGRVVTSGEHDSGWDGQTVTIPVKAVSRSIAAVQSCFAISTAGAESVKLFGTPTAPEVAARAGNGTSLKGRLRLEYLGAGRTSWLALASSVARNMGLGRAWSGVWIAFLVAALMLLAIALGSRLIMRELHG